LTQRDYFQTKPANVKVRAEIREEVELIHPGEHPRDTALREAEEELSIEGQFLREGPIFVTVAETVGQTAGHTDVSLWYILRGDRTAELDYDNSEFLKKLYGD